MDGKDKKQPAQDEASGSWKYDSGKDTELPEASGKDAGAIEWSASEFVAHEKGFGWYFILAVSSLAVAAALYFVTHEVFSAIAVLIMVAIFGVSSARRPRVVAYRLDGRGLTSGGRFYPYGRYKAFAMPEDGPFSYVVLIPLKHFEFPISAYLAPDSQKEVVGLLSTHLPLERGELSITERLMRQLRF